MERMDELNEKLNAAKNVVNEKGRPLLDLEDKLKQKWSLLIKSLLDTPTKIRVSMGYTTWINVSPIDEDGNVPFGAECEIRIGKDYNRKTETYAFRVSLGTGTTGSFDITDLGQINKYKIMGCLCDNFSLLNDVFIKDIEEYDALSQEYTKATRAVDDINHEIFMLKEELALDEFTKSFDKNAVYTSDNSYWNKSNLNGYKFIKFEKETEGYEYIKLGSLKYDYINNVQTDEFVDFKTKRFPKGTLLNWAFRGTVKKYEHKNN